MRFRRCGYYSGYYDPNVVVRHLVPTKRLTRRYFRQWFFWHGKTTALMLDDVYPELDMPTVPRLGGAPRFLYRQALRQCVRWAATRRGDPLTGRKCDCLHPAILADQADMSLGGLRHSTSHALAMRGAGFMARGYCAKAAR